MKQNKWDRRDKKRFKRKNGMRVSGKSVFNIVKSEQKRAKKWK